MVDADHSTICKYESADENNYKLVSGNLVQLVEDSLEKHNETLTKALMLSKQAQCNDRRR